MNITFINANYLINTAIKHIKTATKLIQSTTHRKLMKKSDI
jgi:hypothetical protein